MTTSNSRLKHIQNAGFPVQKSAMPHHRRGGPYPGRGFRGGDEADHQAAAQEAADHAFQRHHHQEDGGPDSRGPQEGTHLHRHRGEEHGRQALDVLRVFNQGCGFR